MARRPVTRVFNPKRKVVARRPFSAAGHRYTPGMEFPWKQLAVDTRRVTQMFDQGFLRHEQAQEEAERFFPKKPEPQPAPRPVFEQDAPVGDDLDAVDSMTELRAIASAEGAPYKVSKADQRAAIREHREAMKSDHKGFGF